MIFVAKGVVIAGFINRKSDLFQSVLQEGDVFVFPKGLLHYCLNGGFEDAIVYSVFNAQNPGVVDLANATFGDKESVMGTMKMAMAKLVARTVDDTTKPYDEL
ncbi:hypothetical protein L6452_28791 [Arctium lappa]|uniref:Uncharacterized protein n=1 Tax=Arctium lappa TaxID=4217 RepID=A0ACB8ZYV7_ARCLA|nr:hypothetical protein L6452_28791 [Arctium lappa]